MSSRLLITETQRDVRLTLIDTVVRLIRTQRSIGQIKSYGKGIFDIGKEDNFQRVNSFASAFWKDKRDEPNAHLGVFKTKLNILGLDFKYDKNTSLRDGENNFELSRLGGAFGKSPETPHDEFDDENGFANGDSYNLNINLGTNNGLYDITAGVVKQAEGVDGDTET